MEIDGIAAILHLDIVDAAEEIVRVGVHAMCGPWRIDISPAARNRDLEVADAQEGQHSIHRRVDATHQAAQFFQFVQCMTRLPSNATVERRHRQSRICAAGRGALSATPRPGIANYRRGTVAGSDAGVGKSTVSVSSSIKYRTLVTMTPGRLRR